MSIFGGILGKIFGKKAAPAPAVPDEVIAKTRAKYVEALERLTGTTIEA